MPPTTENCQCACLFTAIASCPSCSSTTAHLGGPIMETRWSALAVPHKSCSCPDPPTNWAMVRDHHMLHHMCPAEQPACRSRQSGTQLKGTAGAWMRQVGLSRPWIPAAAPLGRYVRPPAPRTAAGATAWSTSRHLYRSSQLSSSALTGAQSQRDRCQPAPSALLAAPPCTVPAGTATSSSTHWTSNGRRICSLIAC